MAVMRLHRAKNVKPIIVTSEEKPAQKGLKIRDHSQTWDVRETVKKEVAP